MLSRGSGPDELCPEGLGLCNCSGDGDGATDVEDGSCPPSVGASRLWGFWEADT